jgi:hypothetical protein
MYQLCPVSCSSLADLAVYMYVSRPEACAGSPSIIIESIPFVFCILASASQVLAPCRVPHCIQVEPPRV